MIKSGIQLAEKGYLPDFILKKAIKRLLMSRLKEISNKNNIKSDEKLNFFKEFEKINRTNKKIFVIAGGVAANKKIRSMLINLCKERNYESIFPPIELCGDNAAMIGMVGLEKFKLNQFNDLDYPAKPRWPLDEKANFLKGAGVKL